MAMTLLHYCTLYVTLFFFFQRCQWSSKKRERDREREHSKSIGCIEIGLCWTKYCTLRNLFFPYFGCVRSYVGSSFGSLRPMTNGRDFIMVMHVTKQALAQTTTSYKTNRLTSQLRTANTQGYCHIGTGHFGKSTRNQRNYGR